MAHGAAIDRVAPLEGEGEGSGGKQRVIPRRIVDHTQGDDREKRNSRVGRDIVGRGEGITGRPAVVRETRDRRKQ